MRIDSQFFQTLFDSLQITQRIAQTLETIAGNKSTVHQPAHLRFDIRKPQRHGHIHAPFQTFVDIKHRGQDLFDLFSNIHHRIVQFSPHFFMQHRKAFFGPHRTTVGVDQLIHTTGYTVVNQIQHFTVRVKIQPQLGFVGQFLMQIFDW